MDLSDFDFLTVVISRNEVESGDTSGPIATLSDRGWCTWPSPRDPMAQE